MSVLSRFSAEHAECHFGMGHSKANKINTIKNNPMKYQYPNNYHILIGQMASTDNHILVVKDRIYHTKDKSYLSKMFSGACVFVDNTSGFMSINIKWI